MPADLFKQESSVTCLYEPLAEELELAVTLYSFLSIDGLFVTDFSGCSTQLTSVELSKWGETFCSRSPSFMAGGIPSFCVLTPVSNVEAYPTLQQKFPLNNEYFVVIYIDLLKIHQSCLCD